MSADKRPSCELVSSCTREADGSVMHPDHGAMPACGFHVRERNWMSRFVWYPGVRMTKWALVSDEQRAGLDATRCGLKCSGCGEELATEGDFARHFVLKRSEYLNLGDCPKSAPGKW